MKKYQLSSNWKEVKQKIHNLGQKVKAHNEIVRETGVGDILPELESDMNRDYAGKRYEFYTSSVLIYVILGILCGKCAV